MILSRYGLLNLNKEAHKIVLKLSSTVSQLFEDIAFLIIGITLFGVSHKFEKIDLFVVLLNFGFLFISRLVAITIVSCLVNTLKVKNISANFRNLLVFSGIRGAMCFLISLRFGNSKFITFLRGRVFDFVSNYDCNVNLSVWISNAISGQILSIK